MSAASAEGVRPLTGCTVVVTRPADQSATLVVAIRRLGAHTIVAPAIEIAPARSASLTRALRELEAGAFSWITLTSRATVEMLASRLPGPDALGNTKAAAIGDGTAAAFRAWTRRDPDLVPASFTTTDLARAFPRGAGRVLCARADIAPAGLEVALAEKGWSPTRVDAYRTRFPRSLPSEARTALRAGRVDAVTFTSASTVRGYVGALGTVAGTPPETPPKTPKVVCIGPVTATEARNHGLTVHAVATPHSVDGVVDALVRVLSSTGGPASLR